MKKPLWLLFALAIAVGNAAFGYAQASELHLNSIISLVVPVAYAGLAYWLQLLWIEARNVPVEAKRKHKLAELRFSAVLAFGPPALGLIVGLFRLSPTLILYFSLILIGYGVIYLAFREA